MEQGELWGVVVEQSLADPGVLASWDTLAEVRSGTWRMLLVRVTAARFDGAVAALRAAMVPAHQACWYAHFFDRERLVAVFEDAVFELTSDPVTWEPAVMHGLSRGVPLEQLDFDPCTADDARARFGLAAAPQVPVRS